MKKFGICQLFTRGHGWGSSYQTLSGRDRDEQGRSRSNIVESGRFQNGQGQGHDNGEDQMETEITRVKVMNRHRTITRVNFRS